MNRISIIGIIFLIAINSGYAQIHQTKESLELEDPVAANFYVKKIPPSQERDLLEAEIAFLSEDYQRLDTILKKLSNGNNCHSSNKLMFQALLEHKLEHYSESQNSFELLWKRALDCRISQSQASVINYWHGYTLLEQGKLTLAEKSLSIALTYFSQDSSRYYIKRAHIYFWLGSIKLKQFNYDSALYYLNRSLLVYQNTPLDKSDMLIRIFNNVGAAYNGLWNYGQAIHFYEKAIQLNIDKRSDPEELAIAYSNLGRFYELYENHLKSKEQYEKAMALIPKAHLAPEQEALIFQNYGAALSKQYQFVPAQEQYLIALEILEPYKETYGDTYARILINIGYSYINQLLFNEADTWGEQLDSFMTTKDLSEEIKRESQIYRAVVSRLKSDYKTSLSVLNDLEKTSPQGDQYFTILFNKALSLEAIGEMVESRKYYHQLLTHYKGQLPVTHPQIIHLLNSIGATFHNMKEGQDSSEHYFGLSKKYNQLASPFNKDSPLYSSKVEWIVSNYYLLSRKINLFEAGHENIEGLKLGEGLIYSSLSVLQSQRIEMNENGDVINFLRLFRDFFDLTLKYYHILYNNTKDDSYIDKAFNIVEKTKYQSLQNAMKLDRVRAFARVTDKILTEEKKLLSEVAQLEYQYSQETARQSEPLPALLNEYANQLQYNASRLDNLIDSIKINLPDYYNLKFNKSSVTTSQIKEYLLGEHSNTAWISFYTGEETSYAILILPKNIFFLSLGKSQAINRQILSLKNTVNHELSEAFYKASIELYNTLFEKINSCLISSSTKINSIIIVPDGQLNFLNFELLGKSVNGSWRPNLFQYTFSYGYSSTLLWHESNKEKLKKVNNLNMIGVAPEFKSGDAQATERAISNPTLYDTFDFSPLSKNQDEIIKSSEVLKRHRAQSKLFLGDMANETNFKNERLDSYDIIHLATHGFVSNNLSQQSGIAFSKDSNSSDDGILFMDEIFSLRNDAFLICLSACETGLGILNSGEGVIGLTRAFIYSGTKNMVVSLWKVNDESTEKLMVNFYSKFVRTMSVSRSLQQAKIKMLRENRIITPANWAAFIHIGLD